MAESLKKRYRLQFPEIKRDAKLLGYGVIMAKYGVASITPWRNLCMEVTGNERLPYSTEIGRLDIPEIGRLILAAALGKIKELESRLEETTKELSQERTWHEREQMQTRYVAAELLERIEAI